MNASTETYKGWIRAGWGFVLLAFVLYGLTLVHYFQAPAAKVGAYASAGDWVAGVTAPFLNLAGFIMIFVAFRQQAQGMQLGQTQFLQQQFEQTFFQLLSLHHEHALRLNEAYARQDPRGDFFRQFRAVMEAKLPRQGLKAAYETFYEEHHSLVDSFVRHLHLLLIFIDEADALKLHGEREMAERRKYANMLEAQLSRNELYLWYVHLHFGPEANSDGLTQRAARLAVFDRLARHETLPTPS